MIWSYISVIIFIIFTIIIVMLIIYIFDRSNVTNIYGFIYSYLPFNKLLIYFIIGLIGILLIMALTTIFNMSLFLPTFFGWIVNSQNLLFLFSFTMGFGSITMFSYIKNYIETERKTHIRRIWNREEVIIKIVRDFRENGPPRRDD